MQQFNFGALDFSRVPQREREARQAWYKSLAGAARGIGQTAQQAAQAQQQQDQDDLAEEWRQRQWNSQQWQQADMRRRLDEQDAFNRSQRQDQDQAADELRQKFLSRWGDVDLSNYGLGAQFAMDRVKSARSWDDLVDAGSSLATIINQRDMIDAQRAEQAQSRYGQDFSTGMSTRLGLMGFDPTRPEQSVGTVRKDGLQEYLNGLQRERMQLEHFMRDPANRPYVTDEMVRQYNNIKAGINATIGRMHPRSNGRSF